MIRVTLPRYSLPTSTSLVRPSIQAIAFLAASPSVAAIWIVPSSSTLIWVPVSAVIWRITLPPAPMTSRILSTGILMVVMRGAYGESSLRLALMTAVILSRIVMRATRACSSASRRISFVMPETLMSICRAVTPSAVPVTLKSMSP